MNTIDFLAYINTDKFRQLINSAKEAANIYNAEIIEADKALGDIRHYCEFNHPISRKKETEICRLMYEYSVRRRVAKDALDVLTPLLNYLNENPKICNDIGRITNEMKRAVARVEGERKYNPRVLTDLFADKKE